MKQLPFIPTQILKRSVIHDQYGGNRQSGISTPANAPYIFIFSGVQGKQHGYKDAWDNPNVFSYTGEGQSGDMKFTKGNLALREHVRNGKRVFLFEYIHRNQGLVKFSAELILFDTGYFETFDSDKILRQGIRFFFHRTGVNVRKAYEPHPPISLAADFLHDYIKPTVTERQGLVTSRVGQGAYRKRIIYRWNERCAVTGVDKPEILIASHILGWKDSDDEQKLDVNNGILLSPTFDALFDRHLISFEDSGEIILSDKIEIEAYQKIGVTGNEIIVGFNSDNHSYLDHHRKSLSLI